MDNQQVSYYEEEVWKVYEEVPRFEVSSFGNIRYVDDKRSKYVTKHPNKQRCAIQYKLNGQKKQFYLHRAVAKTFIPNPENKPEVNHIDGVPSNNRVDNLEWCTRSENVQHAFKTGLNTNAGAKNSRAVLTEEFVHRLCKWYEDSTENTPKIAEELFGISPQQASKIRSGHAWTHISCLYNIVPLRSNKNSNDHPEKEYT